MSVPKQSIFPLALILAGAVALPIQAQELAVPPAPYEEDTPEVVDPLANEPEADTRIAKDAARIADLVGEEQVEAVSDALAVMFDSTEEDSARIEAASALRELANSLSYADSNQRSAKRQIRRRVRLAEAALFGMRDNPDDEKGRLLANSLILRTAVDFENSGRDAHAEIARMDYQQLKQYHPAIFSRLRSVINDEYFNYNIHMVLSEAILTRLVSDYRSESGGVAECILGAWVTGCQLTDTVVSADIKPSQNSALFELKVNGHTTSNTQGRKSPATVFTRGNHHFNIVKKTFFDGTQFTSSPANMDVNVRNQTVGIRTDFDRIPILRRIVQKIAAKEVAKKHGQSEAIAARKLADEALPRFEREVGQKFAEANGNLQNNVLQNLRNKGIEPQAYSARSSETHLALSSRTMATGNLGGTPPPMTPAPARGIAVQIHESSINAAIDSLGISGKMTVEEVIGRIESSLSDFMGRQLNLRPNKNEADDKTDFDFTETDAIRVRFDEGQVIIILRTGFYQKDKDRQIERHVFEIPLGIALEGGKLALTPPATDAKGILSLRPQAIEGRSSLRSVAQARGVAKGLIDNTFKEPVVKIKSSVDITMADGANLPLRVTQFELTDGWLTVVFE